MVCIYCGSPTKVTNSRLQKRQNSTWRRRECLQCQATVTTLEKIDLETALSVTSSKNSQPFSRDKLLMSLYESLKHRPSAVKDAQHLTDTIIGSLLSLIANGSVEKQQVASIALDVLQRFDNVAGVHYAAFHRTAS